MDFTFLEHSPAPLDDDGLRKHLSEVTKALRFAMQQYDMTQEALSHANAESSDLLHFIELHPNLNAAQGYKVYAKLADNRRERRELKMRLEFLEPLCKFVEANGRVTDLLAKLQGDCNAVLKYQGEARYRVKTDILDDLE